MDSRIKKIILFSISYGVLLLAGPIPQAAGTSRPKTPANIIMITIDTLRADHLACYGYGSIKTPHIDGLAQKGVLFSHAYTPVPLTLPSHVSMMTGQYPIRHGVVNNGSYILADSSRTLPEILRSHGYVTGAIVASYVLDSRFGLNQGFDTYDDQIDQRNENRPRVNDHLYRGGEIITDLARQWLTKNQKKLFFLWLHYFDPHTPYQPPAPFDSEYQGRPYDGEIAYTDQCLGHLFQKMEKLNLMENTLLILVGDHGEGLWEHNEQTHGLFIYEATLRVPLIMHYPKGFLQGQTITSLVGTVDLMPTILDFSGLESKDLSLQGLSLIPYLTAKNKTGRNLLYCESRYPQLNFNWSPLEGIVTSEGWKYIEAPKPELYNLKNDPHEKINLYATNTQKAESLKKELLSLKKELSEKSGPQGDAQRVALSPETRERLRSLGYISGTVTGLDRNEIKGTTPSSLPDPKDMAILLAQIDRARECESQGHADQAIELYEKVLSRDPDNIMARFQLGLAYQNTGKPERAVTEIQRAIELDSQHYEGFNILGTLYDQLARPDKAITAYRKALAIEPSLATVHNNLGLVYLKMNVLDSAREEFKQAVSFSSDDPILTSLALANLGEVYKRRGDPERAVKKLKQSIRHNEYNHDIHVGLADLYVLLQDMDEAVSEWKRIIELWPDDYIAPYRLAQVFLSINETDQAIRYLRRCLQLQPDYIEARILLQQISQNAPSTGK